jgi:hypothetical protein
MPSFYRPEGHTTNNIRSLLVSDLELSIDTAEIWKLSLNGKTKENQITDGAQRTESPDWPHTYALCN